MDEGGLRENDTSASLARGLCRETLNIRRQIHRMKSVQKRKLGTSDGNIQLWNLWIKSHFQKCRGDF